MARTKVLFKGDFTLWIEEGVGMNKTPWTGLKVESDGIANKHVIRIDLDSRFMRYEGKPVKNKYKGVSVSHGMRMSTDTLNETREYAQSLLDAVEFAEDILRWFQSEDGREFWDGD